MPLDIRMEVKGDDFRSELAEALFVAVVIEAAFDVDLELEMENARGALERALDQKARRMAADGHQDCDCNDPFCPLGEKIRQYSGSK